MTSHDEKEFTSEEIKKEFQVERMILFSDAVFAIVITLMAIEVRLPETSEVTTPEGLTSAIIQLLPVFVSYCISFLFVGVIWFQHLRMFSLLKDYDTGLVARNLILLFFVSLFPFSSSVMTRASGAAVTIFLYMGIILLCTTAQFLLYDYILIRRPALRVRHEIDKHLEELRKRKISLVGFIITFILITATYFMIRNPEMKMMSTLWMAVFPVVYRMMIVRRAVLTKKRNSARTEL